MRGGVLSGPVAIAGTEQSRAAAAAILAYLLETASVPAGPGERRPRSSLAWSSEREDGRGELTTTERLTLEAHDFYDAYLEDPPGLDPADEPDATRHREALRVFAAMQGLGVRAFAEGPDEAEASHLRTWKRLSAAARAILARDVAAGAAPGKACGECAAAAAIDRLTRAGLVEPDPARAWKCRSTRRGRAVHAASERWAAAGRRIG